MFIMPTKVERVTSHFRTRSRPDHHGTDFANPGTHEIFAVADASVIRSYKSASYGECIILRHSLGGVTWESLYAHLREGSRKVFQGQSVKQGDVIGIMGNTGYSFGQHLHFELHKGIWNINKTNAVDPMLHLSKPQPIKPTWDNMEIKQGQIGRITILKPINLWTDDDNGKLQMVRILQPNERYRVYGYRDKYHGQYDVGAGHWITKMDGYIRYETPSKALLESAAKFYLN